MKKLLIAAAALALSSSAFAAEYVCKVYCNSGQTYVTVNASSASDAANKVDAQGHQICKSDGKGNASNQTMRPEQCSRK